jgi:lysophospholipase L1-like esterase
LHFSSDQNLPEFHGCRLAAIKKAAAVGLFLILTAISAVGCASSSAAAPTPPPPPTDPYPNGPQISCPASTTVQSTNGQPVVVPYASATATGGAPPVTVSCTPAAATTFPIGASSVACTATDARQRTASCSFTISVTTPPKLSVTSFLAFGDSMTAGEVVSEGSINGYRPLLVDPSKSYPTDLFADLTARYTTQTVSVSNQGQSGEKAVAATHRLSGLMATRQYDAVLLMEGANDLLNEDSVQMLAAANAMQFMVRDAKSRGLKVLLATLPPQDPSGFRGREGAALVAPYNNALATVAANESIPLVDVYQAFGANFSGLIDSDGLHPTPAGYQKIADTFFAAIKQNLEAGPSVTSSSILAGPHPRSHQPGIHR